MRPLFKSVAAATIFAVLATGIASAQPHTVASPPKPLAAPAAPSPVSDEEVASTQDQLISLLRTTPTLTEVISRDPSLLSDQDYVARTNPQLAQFLQLHPEIARNPDFWLFNGLPGRSGQRHEHLERRVWPEFSRPGPEEQNSFLWFLHEIAPGILFLCVLGVMIWLVRMLLENRRWNRIFKLQTEVHSKLIDRFGSSQELLTYMATDAGKRFLEASPIPVDFEQKKPSIPSPVARILNPLQIGIVLSLLGTGILYLRHSLPEMEQGLLVFGTLFLMPGIGFILSAAVTWILANHLGLMPSNEPSPAATHNHLNPPYDPREHQ